MRGKTVLRCITILALTCAMLFSSGCSCLVSSPQPYGPKVTSDGTGGAIAVYEEIKGGNQHNFFVQKISPEGHTLWGDKGVLIGGGYKYWDSFHDLHIVSDDYGGALVSWIARPSSQQREYVSHITSVDTEGNVRWQREVRGADHMISDGTGGAIIATDCSYDERTLFIIKIDSEGNFIWGEDGVYVRREGYCDHSLDLAGDGSGGAIFVWRERQGEPGQKVSRIMSQRIDTDGNLSWGQDGVLLYTTSEEVSAGGEQVISDGSGGAIAVWHQWPLGRIESGMPEALLNDICVQRVDAEGNILWQENGIPLGITKGGGECPSNALVVSDGAGGAIVIWEDLRQGLMSMYAQKIDTDGNIKWQPSGEEVCYIETHSSFWPRTAVSDGSGGAIVTFGIRAQRIDADGRTMWPGDGVMFTTGGTHAMDCDGHGGAVIVWGTGKSMFKSERSYVQRIDSEGKLLWGKEGIRLDP